MTELESEPDQPPVMPASGPARRRAVVVFAASTLVGGFFFLAPIRVEGRWTIPFDVAVSAVQDRLPQAVSAYSAFVIVLAALVSVLAAWQHRRAAFLGRFDLSYFHTGPTFLALRVLGAVLAILVYFQIGPSAVLDESAGGLIFGTLIASVAVIVPIGAVFVTLFVAFGALEFVGTFARPIMRPLFRVPGRGALDGVASFVGSYSVGLYVTNLMYKQGRYTAREAAVIATCFSTVSIGFVAVVTSTLDIMAYFPLVFLSTTLVTFALGVILCRLPPLSTKPDSYAATPQPERQYRGNIARHAVVEAVASAAKAGPVHRELGRGLVGGFKLSMTILPTIMSVGLIAVLVAEHTPLFGWLGKPVEPLLALLGIPDADVVAPASLIGVTEMFLPALISIGVAVEAKFFIAVLSISQLLFFSATIPLLLELDVPIKLRDCLALFALRTAIAIPLTAGLTHLVFAF
ncbi:MAG: YjiH family protein [Stackebrandtia sp.]